jgi:hypothetical protein
MNTISTYTGRDKYFKTTIETALRNALVAEKICLVDRSELKRIQNPYGTEATAVVSALTGTYAVSDITTTDDALTVADEVKAAEHIFDFEDVTSNFDLYASRMDSLMYAVANKIDNYVVNVVTEAGTGTYTTPTGGFATAANVNEIFANLISKTAGYQDAYRGLFVVIEPTDLPGIIQAGATNGFSFADSVLNNGQVGSYMGVDIHVVAAGTFANATSGTQSYTNSAHRVFGVKGVATYATPRGLRYEEKAVSGKTGKEIVVYAAIGAKVWVPKAALIVDITLA